jgi:MFS superfamily sulfate permease-like transporter
VNLACINVAQVLGYARIAGMPVVTGLYTLLLPPVAFALFGSSRHLVVAADSATAAILASSLSLIAAPSSAHYVSLVGALALLTAAMLLLARIFKLGFLADFLSRTVLSGFLAGVGAQVAIAMLGDMLGVAETSRNSLIRVWQVLGSLPAARHGDARALGRRDRRDPAGKALRRAGRCRWLPSSLPSPRARPITSPRTASRSSARWRAACRRFICPK